MSRSNEERYVLVLNNTKVADLEMINYFEMRKKNDRIPYAQLLRKGIENMMEGSETAEVVMIDEPNVKKEKPTIIQPVSKNLEVESDGEEDAKLMLNAFKGFSSKDLDGE